MAAPASRYTSLLAGTFLSLRSLTISGTKKFAPLINRPNYFRTLQCASSLHTTPKSLGLMEFFDDKKNWGEQEVKVGRAWKMDELRIKSNEDLHKLWFVLLKEKNMLLTMEHASKEEYRLFANPERIDKVKESMKNLEDVVRERNRAYWLLETGETGERPGAVITDDLGRRLYRKFAEHSVPVWMNKHRRESLEKGAAVARFKRCMREQRMLEKRKYRRRIRNHVCGLFRRFPNASVEAIQEQYPEVNVTKLRQTKRARGNHDNLS